MGQARNRGTLAQRTEQAREAFNAAIEASKLEVEEMDNLEKRQREGLQHWVDSQLIPQMDRKYGPLMRVDFTQAPMMVKTQDEDELKERVEKLRQQYETLQSKA